MYNYNFIDHTADICIFAKADSIEELFFAFAQGFKNSVIKRLTLNPLRKISFSLESDSYEELLVDFLNELNYLFSTDLIMFKDIRVSIQNNASGSLFLDTEAEMCKVSIEDIVTEIKAATYHDLKIDFKDGMFSAYLVFDV